VTDFDDWDDDPDDFERGLYGDENCGWNPGSPAVGRGRRRAARRWRHRLQAWRKVARHDRDRFWQARHRAAFDDQAPF
jgi:hypothetical protein